MSSSLNWLPVQNPAGNWLATGLKFKLRSKYGNPVSAVLTESDVPFLEGLAACNVEDAQTLIDAIEKYSEVSICEEF